MKKPTKWGPYYINQLYKVIECEEGSGGARGRIGILLHPKAKSPDNTLHGRFNGYMVKIGREIWFLGTNVKLEPVTAKMRREDNENQELPR